MNVPAARYANLLQAKVVGQEEDAAVAAERETVGSVAGDEAAMTTARTNPAYTTLLCRSVEGQRNQREVRSSDRPSRRPMHCCRLRHAP